MHTTHPVRHSPRCTQVLRPTKKRRSKIRQDSDVQPAKHGFFRPTQTIIHHSSAIQ